MQRILGADARPSTPAIRQPVARASDALGNVGIAYAKGRAVLGMVERWLGAEAFQRGVRSYLAAHARGNATGGDLWDALSAASGQDVAAVMRGFLDQPGAPLLTVEVTDAARGTVEIAQQRLHAPGVEVAAQGWQVPVVLEWSDGTVVHTRELLLAAPRQQVNLGGPVAWLFPNAGGVGYYRWRLPGPALADLAAHAPERLAPGERISLLGNAGGLLDAGLLAGDDYLRIVGAAVGDPEPAVVDMALDGLRRVQTAFVSDAGRERFAAYVQRTVGPALERIGREPRAGEAEAAALLRPGLLEWLGASGRDPAIRAWATTQADALLQHPETVPADLAGVVLRLSALDGDAARFDAYRQRFEGAQSPSERRRFLAALGAFERPELSARSLAYVLTGPLRDNELNVIPGELRDSDANEDRAFAWLREHWAEMSKRTPPELVPFLVFYAGDCSAERMALARTFFGAPERSTPAIAVRVKRLDEQVAQCVALRQRDGASVARFLAASATGAPSPPPAAPAATAAPGATTATTAIETSTAAPEEERLGEAVVPTAERLVLRLDPGRDDYTGSAEIAVEVRQPVRSFRFHAEAMRVGAVVLEATGGGAATKLQATPLAGGLVEVTATAPLAPGNYRLRVDFGNDFGTQAVGLYRVTLGDKRYLFTDFEPADARTAFPCWDEPGFKIPWRLELTVPAGLVVAGNAPVARTTDAGPGWQTVELAETPPLPSYLVAFVVGPFDVVEVPGMSVPGRILTVAGQGRLAAMAREMTPQLLAGLEAWFGQRYPFAKLDLVAVPEYASGAMENAGLITFLDRILLAPPDDTSLEARSTYAEVATHELAHMWFGDLVTMRWWDDLWLNESFADWLGPKVADEVHPDLGIAAGMVRAIQRTLTSDARPSAPAVRRPVTSVKRIFSNADLTYSKGRAVLGMVEQWLSPEVFRRGVQAYVAAHARGNAAAGDLWSALAAASGQDVAEVMRSFLEQPGFPLLDVEVVDAARGTVEIAQQRFLAVGAQAPAEGWRVPMVLAWSDGSAVHRKPFLLTAARQRIELGGPVTWLFPNAGGRGYYRWRLSPAALSALAAAAPRELDARERIALLGNVGGLLDGGAVSGDAYLRLIATSAGDPDPDVLSAAIGALAKTEASFVGDELRPAFAGYVRQTLAPALARIGSLPRAGEPSQVALLRPVLLSWLGDQGRDPEVRQLARRLAADSLGRPSAVPPELADVAIDLAALDGDAALFDTYRQRFEAAADPAERSRFLRALGYFRDPAITTRALAYAATGPLRPQELPTIAFAAASDDARQDLAFAWVRANWPLLAGRMPPDRVPGLTRFAGGCSPSRLDEGRAFFSAPERAQPAIAAQLARVADQVAECVALRQREGPAVAAFLATSAPTTAPVVPSASHRQVGPGAERRRGSPLALLESPQEAQQAVEDGERVRRAAGDVEVDRQHRIGAVVRLRVADVGAAGDRAGADGDHELGRRHRVVGLLQRQAHVRGHRAGDQQAVGVARRGDELDAEACRGPTPPCRGR